MSSAPTPLPLTIQLFLDFLVFLHTFFPGVAPSIYVPASNLASPSTQALSILSFNFLCLISSKSSKVFVEKKTEKSQIRSKIADVGAWHWRPKKRHSSRQRQAAGLWGGVTELGRPGFATCIRRRALKTSNSLPFFFFLVFGRHTDSVPITTEMHTSAVQYLTSGFEGENWREKKNTIKKIRMGPGWQIVERGNRNTYKWCSVIR